MITLSKHKNEGLAEMHRLKGGILSVMERRPQRHAGFWEAAARHKGKGLPDQSVQRSEHVEKVCFLCSSSQRTPYLYFRSLNFAVKFLVLQLYRFII